MRLHEQRRVPHPQAEVFRYTADFANIDQWDPGVADSRRIGEGPVGVGSRYELDVRFGARTVPMIYEITRYEPDDRVVLVGEGDTLVATDTIGFSTEGGHTVIDYTADLRFKGLLRYLAPLLAPVLKRVGERAVDGLVRALDG